MPHELKATTLSGRSAAVRSPQEMRFHRFVDEKALVGEQVAGQPAAMRAASLAVFLLGSCAVAVAPPAPAQPGEPFDVLTLIEVDGEGARDLDTDDDHDGVPDAVEAAAARAYLPFLSTHPDDACPLSGIVYRARPHPEDAALLHVVYSRLYQQDCGLGGHVGDNEAFGATIDVTRAPPAGLVALRAVSHQGTLCERTTDCGTCEGLNPCSAAPDGRPVLFASKDKHAGAVDLGAGCGLLSCFDSCELSDESSELALLNVGEPDAPLVRDLTAEGFVREEEGWSDAAVLHYDPWSDADFGTAGVVAGDLIDDAFLTPNCRAP